MASEQAHTNKRVRIGSFYEDIARSVVPSDDRYVDVELIFTTIGKDDRATGAPRKIKRASASARTTRPSHSSMRKSEKCWKPWTG